MRFFTLLLFLIVPMSKVEASRCLRPNMAPEVLNKKVLEEANFIGKIKIEEYKDISDAPKVIKGIEYNRLVTVSVIDSYKASLSGSIYVYVKLSPKGVLERPPPSTFGEVGRVYERGIRKEGADFYYYSTCEPRLPEKTMLDFRLEALKTESYIEDYIAPCNDNGGMFTSQSYEGFFDCFLPSKDFGKRCFDNSECEGLCIPNVTKEEEAVFLKKCDNDDYYKNNVFNCTFTSEEIKTNTGRCGKFSNPQGVFLTVKNGFTERINTEKENE